MVFVFQRHFAVFRLPPPTAESLFTIVTSVLEVSPNVAMAPFSLYHLSTLLFPFGFRGLFLLMLFIVDLCQSRLSIM